MENLKKSMGYDKETVFITSFPDAYKKDELKNLRIIRSEEEKLLFDEVLENIKKDLEDLNIIVNYSTTILITELAWNLVIFSRIKHLLGRKEIIKYKSNFRLSNIHKTATDSGQCNFRHYESIDNVDYIHPLYNEFLFKLEKNINKVLELLGLLPQQQLERKKVLFVEKLKQKLVNIEDKDSRYSVETLTTNKL